MLYRLAEMMETRAADLAQSCSGRREVDRAIDRVVWYAGWADKLPQALGSSNPVAGPYFNFTVPEPTGVVAVLAPGLPPLESLVSRIAPVIVSGNAAVVVASETAPLAALELAEAIATSDLPGGVVNLLTGFQAELAPVLAAHMDVNAIDLTGVDDLEDALRSRCSRPTTSSASCGPARQSLWEISRFLELKTVWHPVGHVARAPRLADLRAAGGPPVRPSRTEVQRRPGSEASTATSLARSRSSRVPSSSSHGAPLCRTRSR